MFRKNAFAMVVGLAILLFGSVSSAQNVLNRYVEPDRVQSCPNCNHQLPRVNLYGWRGSPWQEPPSGGCCCGKKSPVTNFKMDVHWPSPWAALVDYGSNGTRYGRGANTTCPRLRDQLDRFANLRLLPEIRKDNGYSGPECDPFGLVGESRRGVAVASTPASVEPDPVQAPSSRKRYPGINRPPQPESTRIPPSLQNGGTRPSNYR